MVTLLKINVCSGCLTTNLPDCFTMIVVVYQLLKNTSCFQPRAVLSSQRTFGNIGTFLVVTTGAGVSDAVNNTKLNRQLSTKKECGALKYQWC